MNMKRTCRVLVTVLALQWAVQAGAQSTYYWRGVNTADLYTHLTTDLGLTPPFDLSAYVNANTEEVDGYKLWKTGGIPGGVPGTNDTAYFDFNTSQTSVWSYDVYNIVIDGAFDVRSMTLEADLWNEPFRDEWAHVRVEKNLSLDNVTFNFGYSSAGGGVGNLKVMSGYTLTLTGENPVTIVSGSNKRAGWHTFDIQAGGALVFNGANQTFNTYGYTEYRMLGGGTVTFSNPDATINLGAAGTSAAPTIYLDTQLLTIHPNQTWNADPTSRISVVLLPGAGSDPGQYIVNSATGGRLDNLDTVNIEVTRTSSTGTNMTIAPRLMGGEYGSLKMSGGTSSNRDHHVYLTDDVALKGRTVSAPGGGQEAAVTKYGLELVNGSGAYITHWFLVLNGYDLDVTNGVLLQDGWTPVGVYSKPIVVDASNSTLTIGGDLVFDSVNRRPDAQYQAADIGIAGNAVTVLNLMGNFETTVKPRVGTNLHLATVNLLGGDTVRTFEVGDSAALSGVRTNSYSIGTLNIGNGTTTGNVQLVNNHLNGNPFVSDAETDKVGEKLIVGTLNIHGGSTLDTNGLNVEVGPSTLTIADDAWLDLNTGLTLSANQVVETFVGLGDQVAAWDVFKNRVKDSGNPGFTFEPTLTDGNTYWMAIPEPSLLGLLVAGGFLLHLRRRRQG